MPAETSWRIEKRLLYTRYSGELTAEEMRRENIIIRRFLQSTPYTVHYIVDVLELKKFPLNMRLITQVMDYRLEPNLRHEFLITTNPVITFLGKHVGRVPTAQLHIVASEEAARSLLQGMDESTSSRI